MTKPLKIDKDGKLAVRESDVERAIQQFLEAEGWTYIHTKAEDLKRSGAPSHKRATLDAVALRPMGSSLMKGGMLEQVLIMEHKRRNARTEKKHLVEQAKNVAELRRRGFLVYRAPEGFAGDMVRHFKDWYGERFW